MEILASEADDELHYVETSLESVAGDTDDDHCQQNIGGAHVSSLEYDRFSE